ncbi:MAG: hypothetical protein AB7D06_17790 [Pedobacter sp.]
MPEAKGPKKTHRYDNEFKVKAVRLSQLPGVQVKDVAGYQIVVQRNIDGYCINTNRKTLRLGW